MKDVGTFNCHLVYFTAFWCTYFVAIWYISWLFGIFSRFGMLYQEKSGNPALHSRWGKLTIQT
jgi:uncharacterized SAM-binding protein YcdF (DUF218 family)